MGELLSNFGRKGVDLKLSTISVDIEDTAHLSKYFNVVEFSSILTAGKNSIAFNGSSLLKTGSEIQVQCLDSNGNSLYLEYPRSKAQYTDVANYLVSIHVYNENYNGPGRLILVGTTKKNEIVRWIANVSIDKTLNNTSKTRFYSYPTVEARSLLYPIIASSGTSLTNQITFSGSFYSYAISPLKDTLQSKINPKRIDTDYRLFYNNQTQFTENTFPTMSFNSQMEGQEISILPEIINKPFAYTNEYPSSPSHETFTIKKVIDNKTIQISDPFFYQVGKDSVVTNINSGQFTSSYKWVAYNTGSDAYLKYVPLEGPIVYGRDSYAEITYRNLKTFSGYVARHKLYRRSLVSTGDFSLISDESIGTRELLIDPITANQSYTELGIFYNQFHINKYWFTSSNDIQLTHIVTPSINSMKIESSNSSFNDFDGNKYAILKTDSIDTIKNDSTYIPYDEAEYNEIQGVSYNSNFISLKAGSLYTLSMNISLKKEKSNVNSKISFYFTSSIKSMQLEKNFNSQFGLKIGEISTQEIIDIKQFSDKQVSYFTPLNDYYGTLILVPYQCEATISNVSLGIYGDYGFSPDTFTTNISFPISVAGEPFEIKSELFDINSNLIYSNLKTIQRFDPMGESLFTFIGSNNQDPTKIDHISGSLTISQSLFLPNIHGCPISTNVHLMGWKAPLNSPPADSDGGVCYTNITNVSVDPTVSGGTTNDYVNITTEEYNGFTLVQNVGMALAVRYNQNLSNQGGKRIFIDSAKIKYISE